MSVECLDTDTLVSVAAALEWDAPERLDHLTACPRCRASLEELLQLRTALTEAPSMAWAPASAGTASLPGGDGDGRAAEVGGASLPGESRTARTEEAPAVAGASARRRADALVSAATFLVAGGTTLLAVPLLAGVPPGAAAFAAALVVGTASIVRVRPPRRRAGAV